MVLYFTYCIKLNIELKLLLLFYFYNVAFRHSKLPMGLLYHVISPVLENLF
jgi:hypothetical protein